MFSEAEQKDILTQLGRLAASSFFRGSARYPSFLRFIVRKTLEGQASTLKERTLGIEVFGRAPGFNTSGDPIVRVAAAEVRKRLAQYYQEPGHENETKIDLQPGSYVPQFVFPTIVAEGQNTPFASDMPAEHWRCLRTNNPLERLMREIRRRTRVVGAFPDVKSALMLAVARLRHVAATKWGMKRYLQMNRLAEVQAIA